MVKALIFTISLASLLNATSLKNDIKNIIGANSFQAKEKVINILFKNQANFYNGNNVDFLKVTKKLEKNRLLDISLGSTRDIKINFATKQNSPLIFVKLIQDILYTMGYPEIETIKAIRDGSGFLWKVSIKGDHALNPVLFLQELEKRDCFVTSIKQYAKTSWRYNVDISNIDLLPKKYIYNKNISLTKPLTPYWIDISGAKSIKIESKVGNMWHPYVIIYDKELKIINNHIKERKRYTLNLKIPNNAKYLKINDVYTLENIKKGLNIFIQKR